MVSNHKAKSALFFRGAGRLPCGLRSDCFSNVHQEAIILNGSGRIKKGTDCINRVDYILNTLGTDIVFPLALKMLG